MQGTLRKVVMDNMENGEVKFVSALEELTSKFENFRIVNNNPNKDITHVEVNQYPKTL